MVHCDNQNKKQDTLMQTWKSDDWVFALAVLWGCLMLCK